MWKTAKIFNFSNTLQDCASNMNCSNIEVINLNFNVCIARQSMLITSRILQCVENNDTTSRTLINMDPNQNVSPWNGSLRLSSALADCFASVSLPLYWLDNVPATGSQPFCLLPPPSEPAQCPVPHSCNLSDQTLSLWAGASDWGFTVPCKYVLLDRLFQNWSFLKFVEGACFQNLRFEFELPLRNLPWGWGDKKWRYQN